MRFRRFFFTAFLTVVLVGCNGGQQELAESVTEDCGTIDRSNVYEMANYTILMIQEENIDELICLTGVNEDDEDFASIKFGFSIEVERIQTELNDLANIEIDDVELPIVEGRFMEVDGKTLPEEITPMTDEELEILIEKYSK